MNKIRAWSDNEIKTLRDCYPTREWADLIALFPGRSKESIKTKAKRIKVTKKWTRADENILKKEYPVSDAEGTKRTFAHRSLQAIRSKAYRLGLKRKNYFNSVNSLFFDKWSRQMAYVLGFVATDGCISIEKKDDKYELIIQINDLELLEKIKRKMKCTTPVQKIVRVWGPIYRLSICSKRMVSRLLEIGITPRKSLTIRFPRIPKNYQSHFIRGVMDGDGTIGMTKFRDKKYIQLSFVSASKHFISGINFAIDKSLKVGKKKMFFNNGVYVLQYTHKTAKKVLGWIYFNSNIYLERKHKRYVEFIKVVQ